MDIHTRNCTCTPDGSMLGLNPTPIPVQMCLKAPKLVLDSATRLESECMTALATTKEPHRSAQPDVLQHASTRKLLWNMALGVPGLMLLATEWTQTADATVSMTAGHPVPKTLHSIPHMSLHNQVCTSIHHPCVLLLCWLEMTEKQLIHHLDSFPGTILHHGVLSCVILHFAVYIIYTHLQVTICLLCRPIPYTLYPTPYTLYPIPYTLHPIPYTLYV